MAIFSADIDALRASSAVLNAKTAELERLNQRLEALIGRIDASWEGQASQTYIQGMQLRAQKAKEVAAMIGEFRAYVDSTASELSEMDAKMAAVLNSSF